MKRFLASWAVLTFLVVNGQLPVAHAFGAMAAGGGMVSGSQSADGEPAAEPCEEHGDAMRHAGGVPADPDSTMDAACQLACATTAGLSAPAQPALANSPRSGGFEGARHSPWRSLSHAPLLRPPFAA